MGKTASAMDRVSLTPCGRPVREQAGRSAYLTSRFPDRADGRSPCVAIVAPAALASPIDLLGSPRAMLRDSHSAERIPIGEAYGHGRLRDRVLSDDEIHQ